MGPQLAKVIQLGSRSSSHWLEKQVFIYSSKHSKQIEKHLKILSCLAAPDEFCSESGGAFFLECCAPIMLPVSCMGSGLGTMSPGTVTLISLNHSLTKASSCATHPKGRSLKQRVTALKIPPVVTFVKSCSARRGTEKACGIRRKLVAFCL